MPESDYVLDTVYEHWDPILHAYQQFEKKPIVSFDIQEHRNYLYPYEDFKNDWSPKSQAPLADQYEKAVRDNKIVVFVRDNEQRRHVEEPGRASR